MAHVIHHLGVGGHEAAQGGQGFAEGTHVDVYLVLQTEMAGRAPSALADDAQSVSVVHHHPSAVLLGQGADLRQLADVAAHAEHAVGDDESAVAVGHFLQLGLEILHIAVAVAGELAEAEPAAVVDAGVVLHVADHVIVHAHQGADDAQIGLEAGGKGQHVLLAQEGGQLFLQLQMHLQRAVQKAGAGTAGAVFLHRAGGGLHHLGADGQAQIVVGAQHDAAFAVHDDLHVLLGAQGPEIGVDAPGLEFVRLVVVVAFLEQIFGHVQSPCCRVYAGYV